MFFRFPAETGFDPVAVPSEIADEMEDPFADFRADPLFSVQDPGHGRHADTAVVGDSLDRHFLLHFPLIPFLIVYNYTTRGRKKQPLFLKNFTFLKIQLKNRIKKTFFKTQKKDDVKFYNTV